MRRYFITDCFLPPSVAQWFMTRPRSSPKIFSSSSLDACRLPNSFIQISFMKSTGTAHTHTHTAYTIRWCVEIETQSTYAVRHPHRYGVAWPSLRTAHYTRYIVCLCETSLGANWMDCIRKCVRDFGFSFFFIYLCFSLVQQTIPFFFLLTKCLCSGFRILFLYCIFVNDFMCG